MLLGYSGYEFQMQEMRVTSDLCAHVCIHVSVPMYMRALALSQGHGADCQQGRGVCPPLGGQDGASGLGAVRHLEDACVLVPAVLGTGPKPCGRLSGETDGASGHCTLLSRPLLPPLGW